MLILRYEEWHDAAIGSDYLFSDLSLVVRSFVAHPDILSSDENSNSYVGVHGCRVSVSTRGLMLVLRPMVIFRICC